MQRKCKTVDFFQYQLTRALILHKQTIYALPSGQVKRFVTFVPVRSYLGMGSAEVILTFLQENSVDVRYCHGQSYHNASNMSGKYKGVQQRIRHMLSYAVFCPCLAHSLNLGRFCKVETNAAAANLFLKIQQLYKFFSSSTYLWE